jgi:hypothetical protein
LNAELLITQLDFDSEGYGYQLGEKAQTVVGWKPEKVQIATAQHLCSYLFGKIESISFGDTKIVLPSVEGITLNSDQHCLFCLI